MSLQGSGCAALALSSMLPFLEFPHPSQTQCILSSLLLWSFLDLHPLSCASPSCSRMTNRVLRFHPAHKLDVPSRTMQCLSLRGAERGTARLGAQGNGLPLHYRGNQPGGDIQETSAESSQGA